MSKLSSFIHAHAGVFKVGTEVLGFAINDLPVPQALKEPLLGVLVEMNRTANNMGDSAATVEQNLLSELSGGVAETATTTTNPQLQAGLTLVSQLSSSAAAVLSSLGGTPADKVTVTPSDPLPSAPTGTPSPIAQAGAVQVTASPSTTGPAQVADPAARPAIAAPVTPVVTPAAPPPADPALNVAPATQVALGQAVDPNSAHVGPPGSEPGAVAAPVVTADAPNDPGLSTTTATPLQAAEAAMQAALDSGDAGQIEAAAVALSAAARPQ